MRKENEFDILLKRGRVTDPETGLTVEAYPYGIGSTYVSAAFLVGPNYSRRMGRDYDALQKVVGGHRFTGRDDLMATAAENPGELVLTHFLEPERRPRDQELLDALVLYPGGAIASDATITCGFMATARARAAGWC